MNKKKSPKRFRKKIFLCFLLGFLMFTVFSNYGCIDESFEPKSEEPEEPEELKPPVAMFIATPTEGDVRLEVAFDGSLSYVRISGTHIEKFLWNFGDGETDSTSGSLVKHVYERGGEYTATLVVVDNEGRESDKVSKRIVVNEEIIAFRSFLPMNTVPDCGLCDDIYIMNDHGENLRRLTTDKGEELEPAWSPDGSKLAYATMSHSIGNSGIFIINYDGTGEEQLYRIENGQVRCPDWSPDGTKIAFTYVDYSNWMNGIAVLDLESRVVTRLTGDYCYCCFATGSPSWSPDSSKIVFDAFREGSNDIWIMNADGGEQKKIYSGGMAPDWSPDGEKIAFISLVDEWKLCIMRINDCSIEQITDHKSFQPDWSPDGNRIAFMSGEQIFIIKKDGSGKTHLPIPAHSEAPAWRPKKK